MSSTMATANLPKSGAVSRGYNFASTWEQNAPLMEQQHAAIAVLSNAVAERPFPPNLSQDHISGKDNDINASVPTSDSVEESAAIDAVLVNTHQFYKWFTDLESAMKSETEEKYNLYVNTLVERIQICDGILNQVDDTLSLFDELQKLHQTVATKTKALHDACDRLGSYLNRVQEQINSQATFIQVSLGPLMLASTFVLVGDHYQLPPLVQSAEARENGMSISLFCRLSEAHPQAISALQCQYRMCSAIMELSNALIYGNRLRCGSSEVANAKLQICSTEIISLWLKEVLDPNKPVVFINTDQLPALEVKEQKTVNNPTEAYIVSEITGELVKRDIPVGEIGIITPYNSQTTLIRRLLNAAVEIHTIDKYQGTWNSSRTNFCRLKSKLLLQIQI